MVAIVVIITGDVLDTFVGDAVVASQVCLNKINPPTPPLKQLFFHPPPPIA
jgi:hypothetical protein